MDPDPLTAAAALVSIGVTILAYQSSSVSMAALSGILTFGVVFMVLQAGIIDGLTALTNPFVSFFAVVPLAFAYLTIQGGTFWIVAAKSLGIGFLAGAVSMTLFNYWNIH